ncbi:MAG: choice-of-anchor L domain-containing protein [Bacteroidia bacterium]|nr:choice-of-anchor L domain-containing protein [Bacteroidia bacterium]
MKKNLLLSSLLLFFSSSFFAQLATTVTTATNAIQNVLLGGGVVASNITYTGYANALGTFTVTGTNNMGIGTGIVMTTGTVMAVDPTYGAGLGPQGPNNSTGAGCDNGQPGNAYLTGVAGATTFNAAILEFDFVPQSDTVKFNYSFGTEEYMEWVTGGFADVFAFVLSGVSTPLAPTNIALLPGTSTPVTALNVNLTNNSQYYVDNGDGSGTGTAPDGPAVQYDGFTVVMQAKYPVICGETYHIKLMIADALDGAVDAGVFLETGSFTTSAPIAISSDVQFSNNDTVLYEGCGSANIIFIRPTALSATADTFNFTITGTAINGTDYTTINDTIIFPAGADTLIVPITAINDGLTEGIESITLTLVQQVNVCGLLQTLTYTIYIKDLDPIQVVAQDTFLCSGTSMVLTPTITGGGGTINYTWSTGGSTVGTSPTLTISPTGTTDYIISVTDSCGQGPVIDTITVQVGTANFISVNGDVMNDPIDTIMTEGCDTLRIVFTRGGNNLAIPETFNYSITGTATGGTDYSPAITGSVSFPANGTVQALIITAGNDGSAEGNETIIITIPPDTTNPCANQIPFSLVVYIQDLMPIVASVNDTTICAGTSASLFANSTGGGGLVSYNWNLGLGNGQTKNVSPATTTDYIVTVSDNCGSPVDKDTATVTVLSSMPVLTALADVTVCPGDFAGVQTLISGGYGPYLLSWTELNTTIDSMLVITQLQSGINNTQMGGVFVLTVTDKCFNSDNDTVLVVVDDCALIIPNIITPNGDGINDALYFKNLDKYPNSSIGVYNRWGNKIYENANYTNNWVPDVADGVYYYILTISDGRNFSRYFQVIKGK